MVLGALISELVNIFFDNRDRNRRRRKKLEILSTRMERIERVHRTIFDQYIHVLLSNPGSLTATEYQRLIVSHDEANSWRNAIRSGPQYITQGNISKYATRVKSLSMKSVKLCQKHALVQGIRSLEYDSRTKILRINDEDSYYFG